MSVVLAYLSFQMLKLPSGFAFEYRHKPVVVFLLRPIVSCRWKIKNEVVGYLTIKSNNLKPPPNTYLLTTLFGTYEIIGSW